MTIRQFNKITEVVRNGEVVIADTYNDRCREVTNDTNISTLLLYGDKNYHFYIKEGDKPLYELEEIL